MRSSRITVLMTEQEKAQLEAVAGRMGVSSSEYIRLAVDNYERPTVAEDAELRALATELNAAAPAMQASLQRTNEKMEALHAEMNTFFKAKGLRP